MKKHALLVLFLSLVMVLTPMTPIHAVTMTMMTNEYSRTYYVDYDTRSSSSFTGSVKINGYYYKYYTGWYNIYGDWHYFDPSDGHMYKEKFLQYAEETFYFDNSGVMLTGWFKPVFGWEDEPLWVYANEEGALLTGWQKINGKWYYFDEDDFYMYANRRVKSGSKTYYLTSSGAMGTGWFKAGYDDWFYADPSGALKNGWQKINGKWYYFHPEYFHMYSDFALKYNGKIYLLKSSGAMVSQAGWVKIGGKWYYANTDGSAFTGWKKIDGKWYYLRPESGVMENSSLVIIDHVLCAFNSNGVYKGSYKTPGWNKISGNWYYMNSNGEAATGWKKVNSKWYYFGKDGIMVTGPHFVGSTMYFFNTNGALVTKQGFYSHINSDGYKNWYYANADGVCQKGWQEINSKLYYFDPFDYTMYSDGWYDIDGEMYWFDENGVSQP